MGRGADGIDEAGRRNEMREVQEGLSMGGLAYSNGNDIETSSAFADADACLAVIKAY